MRPIEKENKDASSAQDNELPRRKRRGIPKSIERPRRQITQPEAIQKPFSIVELLYKIRDVIEGISLSPMPEKRLPID